MKVSLFEISYMKKFTFHHIQILLDLPVNENNLDEFWGRLFVLFKKVYLGAFVNLPTRMLLLFILFAFVYYIHIFSWQFSTILITTMHLFDFTFFFFFFCFERYENCCQNY